MAVQKNVKCSLLVAAMSQQFAYSMMKSCGCGHVKKTLCGGPRPVQQTNNNSFVEDNQRDHHSFDSSSEYTHPHGSQDFEQNMPNRFSHSAHGSVFSVTDDAKRDLFPEFKGDLSKHIDTMMQPKWQYKNLRDEMVARLNRRLTGTEGEFLKHEFVPAWIRAQKDRIKEWYDSETVSRGGMMEKLEKEIKETRPTGFYPKEKEIFNEVYEAVREEDQAPVGYLQGAVEGWVEFTGGASVSELLYQGYAELTKDYDVYDGAAGTVGSNVPGETSRVSDASSSSSGQ